MPSPRQPTTQVQPPPIELGGKSGVEWLNTVPLAPRTGKSRFRLGTDLGQFAAAPRLAGIGAPGPFAPAPRLARGGDFTPDRRAHARRSNPLTEVMIAPAVTPAPKRVVNKNKIINWLTDVGLDGVEGLQEALLREADDLKKLSELTEEQATEATAHLGLRGIKLKKLLACIVRPCTQTGSTYTLSTRARVAASKR